MRTALKNKQNLKYSLLGGSETMYVVDEEGNLEFTEVDGVSVPIEQGYTEPLYEEPVDFIGNFIPVGSESYARGNVAIAKAFGMDISAYDALLLMKKGEIPVTETSVIWKNNTPRYKTIENALLLDENNNRIDDISDAAIVTDLEVIDEGSADYIVKRVATSMNISLILLRRMNENDYA